MAYLLKSPDGMAQVLAGRVAITRQDNDITKPEPAIKLILTSIRTTYIAADFTRAARRCVELAALNTKWPQARVRKHVAREMAVSTWVVRYLLRRGKV
jgi:hypothetical protein